jgi:hypothetical protein
MRWVGHVVHIKEMRNGCRIFLGNPEGKRLLRRHGHRWKDNIKINLRKIGRRGVDLICLTLTRGCWWAVTNMVVNLRVS